MEWPTASHWVQVRRRQDVGSEADELFGYTADIKGAQITFLAAPALSEFANTTGFEFNLQDHTNSDRNNLIKLLANF